MKNKFTFLLFFVAAFFLKLNAQGGTYFTEYFDNSSAAAITGTTANAVTTPTTFTIGTGDWMCYYSFRSGSGCSPNDPVSVASAKTLRILSTNVSTPAGLSSNSNGPNAYLITPILGSGVNVITWKNFSTSANGTISVYKSSNSGTSWTLVQTVQNTGTGCGDYTLTVNDASANRIKFQNESTTNADLDNISITSVSAILPVTFGSLTVNGINNSTTILWNVETEVNTSHYEVLQSSDGNSFIKVGTVLATNKKAYSFSLPTTNDKAYYRIKAVDKDGKFSYSNTTSIQLNANSQKSLSVYPNPVVNGKVYVQINSLPKGIYRANVFDGLGKLIHSSVVQYQGGVLSQTLDIANLKEAGNYYLQLTNGQTSIQQRLLVR